MGRVAYVCNFWPQLTINVRCSDERVRVARFEDGHFETEDEEIQAGIERNAAFGSSIHWQDDPSVERRKEKEENDAAEQARLESQRQDELKREAEQKANDEARAKADADLAARKGASQAIKAQAKEDVQKQKSQSEADKDKARQSFAQELGG